MPSATVRAMTSTAMGRWAAVGGGAVEAGDCAVDAGGAGAGGRAAVDGAEAEL